MRRRHLLPLALALALAALVMACSESDGRTLPPADPAKTTTTPSTPVIQTPQAEAFTLTSPSFGAADGLPIDFTCEGTGVSPDLTWSGIPPDTAELALVVRDRTADGFIHWVVTGINPLITAFGRGGVPEGTVEAISDAGVAGWSPPCPPAGSGSHSYELALHALPGALAILPGTPGAQAADLVEQASVAEATLTVTYSVG